MAVVPATKDQPMDSGHRLSRAPAKQHRPPDYTAQSVKLRLFLWIAAIMLGLGAIDYARDAKTWQWLKNLNEPPQEPFRSDLADAGWRTADDPAGTFVAVNNAPQDISSFDPAERAWHAAWRHIWDRLSSDERQRLFTLLRAHGSKRPLTAEQQAAAGDLCTRVVALWDEYQFAASQSLATLNPADQTEWTELLAHLKARFTDEALPVLKPQEEQPASNVRRAELQATLVALARHEIKDDTVVFRPAEQEIWFSELARVQDTSDGQHAAAPRVAYLQLHKQPAEYRGQFVTVKGMVRLAYRVPATKNYLDIDEYVVYWLKPDGGPDSPILVYALGVPPGFPPVTDQQPGQSRRLNLREPVEVEGIFFKRAAYAAQGGLFTAPLIISGTPRWQPEPTLAAARSPLATIEFAAAAVAALLLALCVTTVLWKRTARRHAAADERSYVDVGPLQIGPTAIENIRELERQARAEGQA